MCQEFDCFIGAAKKNGWWQAFQETLCYILQFENKISQNMYPNKIRSHNFKGEVWRHPHFSHPVHEIFIGETAGSYVILTTLFAKWY